MAKKTTRLIPLSERYYVTIERPDRNRAGMPTHFLVMPNGKRMPHIQRLTITTDVWEWKDGSGEAEVEVMLFPANQTFALKVIDGNICTCDGEILPGIYYAELSKNEDQNIDYPWSHARFKCRVFFNWETMNEQNTYFQ